MTRWNFIHGRPMFGGYRDDQVKTERGRISGFLTLNTRGRSGAVERWRESSNKRGFWKGYANSYCWLSPLLTDKQGSYLVQNVCCSMRRSIIAHGVTSSFPLVTSARGKLLLGVGLSLCDLALRELITKLCEIAMIFYFPVMVLKSC